MIRTVADRIASSTRPSYRGRHRRARPRKLAAVFRTQPAETEQAAEDRRPEEEELAVAAGGPAAPSA
ncbi:hypothetical protein [Glycomyces tenuis]|uniref:hypothetical protein n=1 Tax=Glycomyces tenuis TaxID=58116 RepID=UPI00040146BE|nr:hypothetical protein [Glycomyces tenuis]